MKIPAEDDLCVYCGTDKAELSSLRLIAARCEDVEGITKILRSQPSSFDPMLTLATAALKWEKSAYDAHAISKWIKEGK